MVLGTWTQMLDATAVLETCELKFPVGRTWLQNLALDNCSNQDCC